MNGIKNIIIDLGGVIINLDRDRCVRAFEALGLRGADEMLGLYRQKEPFLSVETGRISTAEFYDELRRITGRDIPDAVFERAFDEFLVGLPVERLKALRVLRRNGFRTYMISNTNAIMYDGWIKRAFMQEGLRTGDYFDGIITSFAEGCCKPDPGIFETLLRRYSLAPAESVLLDDSEANCDEARRLGMKAEQVVGANTFVSVAERILRGAL